MNQRSSLDTIKEEDRRISMYERSAKQAGMGVEISRLKDFLVEEGFFRLPASTRFHGAYAGGLFDHSMAVTEELLSLTDRNYLKWENRRSPWLVGMHHDLCKIEMYVMQEDGSYLYNTERKIEGHGEASVIWLQGFLNLTEEEIACIRWHMGAFDTRENWIEFGNAVEKHTNVLYTHLADMLASRVRGI